MFHKGLNKEIIVDAAKELIEQEGFPAFSMRKLAEKLNVKTVSLYAHIASMEALFTEVGLSALLEQRDCLLQAIGGQRRDAAITALAEGYLRFTAEHAELYKIIMQMLSGDDAVLKEAASMTAEPFMRVLADYRLTEKQKMHWQRVLRGLMHGFVSEAQGGTSPTTRYLTRPVCSSRCSLRTDRFGCWGVDLCLQAGCLYSHKRGISTPGLIFSCA